MEQKLTVSLAHAGKQHSYHVAQGLLKLGFLDKTRENLLSVRNGFYWLYCTQLNSFLYLEGATIKLNNLYSLY